jgi:hypothetical protein
MSDDAIYFTLDGSAEERKIPNADVSTVATVIQEFFKRGFAQSTVFEFRDGAFLVNAADLDASKPPPLFS